MTAPVRSGGAVAFERSGAGERIFVAVNLSDAPVTVAVPHGSWQVIGDDLGSAAPVAQAVSLAPWGWSLLKD
jgi:hypothetical protein